MFPGRKYNGFQLDFVRETSRVLDALCLLTIGETTYFE